MIGSRLKKTRSLVRWKRTTAPPPGDGAAFWVGFMRGPSSGLCLRELFASDGGAGLGTETDGGRIGAAGPNGLAGNSNALVDNQIRPTSSSIPVDDVRLILFSDRRKLLSAPSRPAVFPQERSKVFPCFAFMPGIPQGPAPPAHGLDVCGRGRVDDHPDSVGAFPCAKPEQLGNAPSRRFCLFGSPQLNVELEHGSEIVVNANRLLEAKHFCSSLLKSSIVFRSCRSEFNGISSRKPPDPYGEGTVA